MSLQTSNVRSTFVANCSTLWTNWNKRDGLGHRNLAREARVRNAITQMCSFMVTPQVVFANISDWGGFEWTRWRLTLNKKYTDRHDIKYSKFVEYCSTIYHESRHAEQFYRIAQGLAVGQLKYPDTSDRQVVQSLGGHGLSVQQKISLFGGGRGVQNSQLLPDAGLLKKWLSIPQNVAQQACNSRDSFSTFIALPKPAWFQRSTNLLEVEDWMRATYKKTFGEMDEFAQAEEDSDLPGVSLRRNVYKMYRNLPEELDAHAIEDLVQRDLIARIGHRGSLNERRDNTTRFGR